MSKEISVYKPHSLERGDKIGLVNPVGEMNKKYAQTAVPKVIFYLERRGYQVAEGKINKERFTEGIQDPNLLLDYYDPYLTTNEQEIRFNPYTTGRRSFLALDNPSPRERARLFNEAVANCDAIFPLVGNRFGMDLIDYIDFTSFRKYKPIFVTFSAASAFLLHLHLRTNTVVFYGPHVHFLAGYENQYTTSSFWHLLEQRGGTFGFRKYLFCRQ
ncbi:MAG: LD-carboxypeptidase [Microgenomates group bacterium]